MQKVKASTEVIGTVLLIAMVIAVATILFISIRKMDLAMSPEFSCLEMQTNSIIRINKVCYNSQTNDTEITLLRSSDDFYIESLDFILNSNTTYSSENCNNCTILEAGESETYYLGPEQQKPNTAKIIINTCNIGQIDISDC